MHRKLYISIARQLCGEANENESALIQQWCKMSSANSRLYDKLRLVLTKAEQLPGVTPFNTEKAWQNLAGQIHGAREDTD
ncbi:MAG: hypothetical protein BGO21_29955 [Dyadobacter sp. 50-39]|nr:MAG: hypothetical protein BGO21_29955 [Dyadobacter sp. 50-39]